MSPFHHAFSLRSSAFLLAVLLLPCSAFALSARDTARAECMGQYILFDAAPRTELWAEAHRLERLEIRLGAAHPVVAVLWRQHYRKLAAWAAVHERLANREKGIRQ